MSLTKCLILLKFHNETVPMTLSVLYYLVSKKYADRNQKIPITLRTFSRWVSGLDKYFISKYTNKWRKRILRKLSKLISKIKEIDELLKQTNESKKNYQKSNFGLDEIAFVNQDWIKRKKSPLRSLGKPGMVIQWDGSEEKFYNKLKIYRMQAVDEKTLYSPALTFVQHENNQGYVKLLQMIVKNGKPNLIKCDRRKGVDPADKNALITNMCKLLGIAILASSNATHKADIERINGPMHSLFNGVTAYKNWMSLDILAKNKYEMLEEVNNYFGKEKPDFSHLDKVTPMEWKMLNAKKHFVITFNSFDAFIYDKKAYAAYDDKGNQIELSHPENGILCIDENSKWIWFSKGIFRVEQLKDSLPISKFISISKLEKQAHNHFDKNGVMILNRETYKYLGSLMIEEGKKIAIRKKIYEMNDQCSKILENKKRLMNDIDNLCSI